MNVWFTSDTHFGHANIIKYCNRPFSSVEEMNEKMVEAWNDVVRPGDRIYHLGDFCFLQPDVASKLTKRLNGEKFLVRGNHDKNHVLKAISDDFIWVKDYFELRLDEFIVLSHFPFSLWNKSHYGSWNLHGHCHGTYKSEKKMQLDVGVDCFNFRPVSYDDIRQTMQKR